MKLLRTFSKPFEAELAKSYLASFGIEAELFDQHTISINWLYSDLLGGIKLMVKEEDLETAARLLSQVEQRSSVRLVSHDETHPPKTKNKYVQFIVAIALLLLGILAAVFHRH